MRSRNRNNTTDLDHEIPNWTVVRTSHTHFKSLRNEGTIHSINNETAPTTYKIAVTDSRVIGAPEERYHFQCVKQHGFWTSPTKM